MVSGSTYSEQILFLNVARELHKLVLDLLKDLQARILLKSSSCTPEGPPDLFVLMGGSSDHLATNLLVNLVSCPAPWTRMVPPPQGNLIFCACTYQCYVI